MTSTNRRAGFTLIELLVVIAIIAVIAAILFPVFARVREKARQTTCLSNMKQLGMAVAQYTDDYDECCPDGVNGFPPGGNGWGGQVYSYVKSEAVFVCPDDTSGGTSSYAYNSNTVDFSGTDPLTASTPSGCSLSVFDSPARSVMLFEVTGNYSFGPGSYTIPGEMYTGSEGGYSPAGYGASDGGVHPAFAIAGAGGFLSPTSLKFATGYFKNTAFTDYPLYPDAAGRHTLGSNYMLWDMHAKWMRGSAITVGATNPNPADCGVSGAKNPNNIPLAAGTECSDSTVAATFSL